MATSHPSGLDQGFGILSGEAEIQVVAATHSPLVLASLEPLFDDEQDKLFWFDLQGKDVTFQEYPWAMQGDVVGWLTSEIFGLKQARSTEAETAIEAAEAFMRSDFDQLSEGLKTKAAIHKALLVTLPRLDPFWPRRMMLTDEVPKSRRAKAEFTLEKLGLRDSEVVIRYRRMLYEMFQLGDLNLDGLRRFAPLITAAVERSESAV